MHFMLSKVVDKKIPRSDNGLAWLKQSLLCNWLPSSGIWTGCCPLERKAPTVSLRMPCSPHRWSSVNPGCSSLQTPMSALRYQDLFLSPALIYLFYCPGTASPRCCTSLAPQGFLQGHFRRALLNIPLIPIIKATRECFCDDKGAEQSAWTNESQLPLNSTSLLPQITVLSHFYILSCWAGGTMQPSPNLIRYNTNHLPPYYNGRQHSQQEEKYLSSA